MYWRIDPKVFAASDVGYGGQRFVLGKTFPPRLLGVYESRGVHLMSNRIHVQYVDTRPGLSELGSVHVATAH